MTQARFEDRALVEAWLNEPTWLEPVDEARVAAIVHHTPQVRRWPPQVDLGRFAPMLHATRFAAASVVLALVGGLLFTTLPTEPVVEPIPAAETAAATPAPEATVTATEPPAAVDSIGPQITLPDELPQGSVSGNIETSAGPLRWARIPAGTKGLSHIEMVAPWGDGLAAWAYGSGIYATNDGVTWEEVGDNLPTPRSGPVGGKHVIVDVRDDRVWIGNADTGWKELDASAMSMARMEGWQGRYRRLGADPMLVDGRVVFIITANYKLPHAQLGIPISKHKALKRLRGDRYALCGTGRGPASCDRIAADSEWIVRFEETPKGLTVIDDRSGGRLGLLKGASADELYEGWHGNRHWAFAIEGDAVVETESPWPDIDPSRVSDFVVAPGGSTPVVRHWVADGRVPPTAPGVPSVASGIPRGWALEVRVFPDLLEAVALSPPHWTAERTWVSTDGIDWVSPPSDVPEGAEPRWIGSGWMAIKRRRNSNDYWMHVGDEWVSLEALELPSITDPRGYGNATFFNDDGARWVLIHPTSG